MSTVRDSLWLWGQEADVHFSYTNIKSRMTPAEGAFYLGIPNMFLVTMANKPVPPYTQHAIALRPCKKVIWSICEDPKAGYEKDMEHIREIVEKFPNICGLIVDDAFDRPGINSVLTPQEIVQLKKELFIGGRQLELHMVIYDHNLDKPLHDHIEKLDYLTFWTWKACNLENLEKNFEKTESLVAQTNCKLMLGIYMYDYGDKKIMPLSLMKKQCELGLQWLREKRIEGMIFLSNCICDIGLETVDWARQWIEEVGDERLPS